MEDTPSREDYYKVLAQLEADYPDDQPVMTLITAIRNAQSGTHGRYREAMRQDNRRTAIPR